MKTDIIICDCHSDEHQIIVRHDEEDKIVYLSIHLITHRNIIKRLWHAIKYVFGYKSRYGAWDSLILNPDDAGKIESILQTIK